MSKIVRYFALMRLFVVAAEPSADRICARLLQSLRRLIVSSPENANIGELRVRGVAGVETQRLGFMEQLSFPSEDIAVMGVTDVVASLPKLVRCGYRLVSDARHFQPDIAVFVDGKGLARRVAPRLPHSTLKIQYVAPSIWAWKGNKRNAQMFSSIFDHLFLLFPFEQQAWKSAGVCNTTVVGSPAVEEYLMIERDGNDQCICSDCSANDSTSFVSARRKYSGKEHASNLACFQTADRDDRDKSQICVMLGSRISEVRRHGPVVGAALTRLSKDMRVVVPVAASTDSILEREVFAQVQTWSCKNVCIVRDRTEVLKAMKTSYVGVIASGTAALECALCGLPSVVIYGGNVFTEAVARWRAVVKYVSIPNLLAGKMILPELLFSACTPSSLWTAISALMNDAEYRNQVAMGMKSALRDLNLDRPDRSTQNLLPSEVAAQTILRLFQKKHKR